MPFTLFSRRKVNDSSKQNSSEGEMKDMCNRCSFHCIEYWHTNDWFTYQINWRCFEKIFCHCRIMSDKQSAITSSSVALALSLIDLSLPIWKNTNFTTGNDDKRKTFSAPISSRRIHLSQCQNYQRVHHRFLLFISFSKTQGRCWILFDTIVEPWQR